MKKRNVIFSFVILILLGISLYFYFIRPKNLGSEKPLNINETIVINDPNISVYSDFYIKSNDDSFIVYNFSKEVVYQYNAKIKNYEVFQDKYIIINFGNKTSVIDKDGNTILTGNYNLPVYNTNNTINYLIIDDKIYDNNIQVIYTLPDYFVEQIFIKNNLLSLDNINDVMFLTFNDKKYNLMVDLNNKQEYPKFDSYMTFNNSDNNITFVAINNSDSYKIFNTVDKTVLIENATIDENLIISTSNDTMYIYKNNVYKNGTKINDNYHMYRDTCNIGSKLVDKNNNIIIDKCMLYYEELFDNVIVGSNNKTSILFINNKLLEASTFSKTGDYISSYNYDNINGVSTYKVYNKSGEEIVDNKGIYYINSGYYQVYDTQENLSYFTDDKLNNISDNFEYANCSYNNFCEVTNDNYNKILYRDGKKVSNNLYDSISINNNYIVAKTLFNTYIYKLGSNNEINIDYLEDIDVDIDQIISKYDLNNIKDKIEANSLLFKKYAYIVENNNSLLQYKKQVMDMFEVIVDNKDYLDELGFLKKLEKLNIEINDNLRPGVAGEYYDLDVKISLNETTNNTLYHELMHFVDFSFNHHNNKYNIYKCNDDYVLKNGYSSNCDLIRIDSNFITESGAETYSGKYFTSEISAYSPAPTILEALEYICGSKEVEKWFFESDIYFKKIWLDIGYSYDDTNKVINALSNQTQINYNGSDDTILIVDALIDLYKYKNNNDFMNDSKFKYMLRSIIDYRKDFYNSKYKEELNLVISDNYNISKILDDSLGEYVFYKNFGDVLIIDGKNYISILCYKGNELGVLLVEYDFDNNIILNYNYILLN